MLASGRPRPPQARRLAGLPGRSRSDCTQFVTAVTATRTASAKIPLLMDLAPDQASTVEAHCGPGALRSSLALAVYWRGRGVLASDPVAHFAVLRQQSHHNVPPLRLHPIAGMVVDALADLELAHGSLKPALALLRPEAVVSPHRALARQLMGLTLGCVVRRRLQGWH
jgi:hypothetical protein